MIAASILDNNGFVVLMAATISASVGWFVNRQAGKAAKRAEKLEAQAARLDEKKVDAEAYDRAEGITGRLLDRQQKEIDRLTATLQAQERRIDEQQAELNRRRSMEDELRIQINELRDQIADLKTQLASSKAETVELKREAREDT